MKGYIRTRLKQYLYEADLTTPANLNSNFFSWFSNSKIVKNGKPLICFHGSSYNKIKTFDFSRIGYNKGNDGHYGYGIYFSEDIVEARTYGNHIYECYLKITNPFTGTEKQILQLKRAGLGNIDDLTILSIDFKSFKDSFKNNPFIYKFIDSVEKRGLSQTWEEIANIKDKSSIDTDLLNDICDIIDHTTLNKNVFGVPDYILKYLKDMNIRPKLNKGFEYDQSLHWITDLGDRSKDFTDIIKRLGYDGVWYGSEIVVFEPTQIKSVKNDGTWDMDDHNIYS